MAELRATVDDILSWDPCDDWPEDRIREMADGRESVSALEALDLPIPAIDRLWLVLRKEMIPEPLLHELACRFAESVLDIFERKHPDDNRPRLAIEAKRRWLNGEISDSALDSARNAAQDAWDAAWVARDAAWAVAWAAAQSAARSTLDANWAARATTWTDLDAQIEIVRGLLIEKGA